MKSVFVKIIPFAAVLLALCGGILAACGEQSTGSAHTEHEYVWSVETEAGCTEAGTRRGVCSCGATVTEPIPAKGHHWDGGRVVSEAGCEAAGTEEFICTRCGEKNSEPIAALGHFWGAEYVSKPAGCEEAGEMSSNCLRCEAVHTRPIEAPGHTFVRKRLIKMATCTDDGSFETVCGICGAKGEERVPALGHSWVKDAEETVPATCEREGETYKQCKRCSVTETTSTPALGHDWQTVYTVDVEPTFESAGSKSVHCNRCDKRRESVPIDRLDPDVEIEYEFRVVRNSGELLNSPSTRISVYDGEELVAEGTPTDGVFKASLLPKTYTVRTTGFPKGYTAEESYTVRPGNPYCDIRMTASVLSEQMPDGMRYTVGSAMYDFTLTTVDGGQITLSSLLKAKKIVVLNFWYTDCGWCVTEFPGLEAAYEDYSDDVAVIAIDVMEYETVPMIKEFISRMKLSFYVAKGPHELYDAFGTGGFPTTVVIDREGAVAYIHDGALVENFPDGTSGNSDKLFRALFAKHLAADFGAAADAALLKLPECTLPAKRED